MKDGQNTRIATATTSRRAVSLHSSTESTLRCGRRSLRWEHFDISISSSNRSRNKPQHDNAGLGEAKNRNQLTLKRLQDKEEHDGNLYTKRRSNPRKIGIQMGQNQATAGTEFG